MDKVGAMNSVLRHRKTIPIVFVGALALFISVASHELNWSTTTTTLVGGALVAVTVALGVPLALLPIGRRDSMPPVPGLRTGARPAAHSWAVGTLPLQTNAVDFRAELARGLDAPADFENWRPRKLSPTSRIQWNELHGGQATATIDVHDRAPALDDLVHAGALCESR